MVANIKVTALEDVIPCSLVDGYQRIGRICCILKMDLTVFCFRNAACVYLTAHHSLQEVILDLYMQEVKKEFNLVTRA
jgi:hypothetical protein